MIEAAMYTALGFFVACLLCLAILPGFYRRAVRLTREAYEAVNPTTYAEVRASQDQALAQYAIERRRLERALSEERNRTAEEKLAAGNLRAELIRIKNEHQIQLEKVREEKETVDAQSKTSSEQASKELSALEASLKQSEAAINKLENELETVKAEKGAPKAADNAASEPNAATDAELANLQTQIATLQTKLARYEDGDTAFDHYDIEPADQSGVIQDLEKQLLNIEAKYIAAQSEVTRLIAQQELTDRSSVAVSSSLEAELKDAVEEKAKLQALVADRERALKRAKTKLRQYRIDLHNASRLTALRNNLISFAREQLPESDRAKLKAAKSPTAGAEKPKPDTSDTKKDETAPAHALVRKIVKASSKSKSAPNAGNANAARAEDASDTEDGELKNQKTTAEAAPSKQGKKDVA